MDRIARSKKFLKPTASLTTPENTRSHPTTAPMRAWLLLLLLLLLAASQRGTSCSPSANSAYRHPMAAVRVIDDLFTTPLLLLCSLWRLSKRSNATTATMKWMRASRAPNEHTARGKGATKTCLSTASRWIQTDPLEPASRTGHEETVFN